jgi:hypothetical protein
MAISGAENNGNKYYGDIETISNRPSFTLGDDRITGKADNAGSIISGDVIGLFRDSGLTAFIDGGDDVMKVSGRIITGDAHRVGPRVTLVAGDDSVTL